MAWVALEGMKFYAFHGVYEAERILGGEYLVDVYVDTGIAVASKSDNLADTNVNYETVFQICQLEMAQSRQLIEPIVAGIIKKMKRQFPSMKGIKVRVKKLNPPVYGKVNVAGQTQGVSGQAAVAWVEDETNFVTKCPRCKQDFLCYKDETCWCKALTNIHPATTENLIRQYGTSCLCGNCLNLYKG